MMLTAAYKNRRRRKRLRASARRAAAGGDRQISTPGVRPRGGWGQGSDLSRSDLLLIRAALRRGWNPSKRVRRRLVTMIVRQGMDADSNRMAVSACSTLIEMSSQDQRREQKLLNDLAANPDQLDAILADVRTRRVLFFAVRALRRIIVEHYGPPPTWKQQPTPLATECQL